MGSSRHIGSYSADAVVNLDISGVKGSVGQLQGLFSKLDLTGKMREKIGSTFKDLDSSFKNYENSLKKGVNKSINLDAATKSFSNIQSLLGNLERDINRVTGKEIKLQLSPQIAKEFTAISADLKKITSAQEKYSDVIKARQKIFADEAALAVDRSPQKAAANYLVKQLADGKDYNEVIKKITASQKELVRVGKTGISSSLGSDALGGVLGKGLDLSSLEKQKESLLQLKNTLKSYKVDRKNEVNDAGLKAGIANYDQLEAALERVKLAQTSLSSGAGSPLKQQAIFTQATAFIAKYETALQSAGLTMQEVFKGTGVQSITEANTKIEALSQTLQKMTQLDPTQIAAFKKELSSLWESANKQTSDLDSKLNQQAQVSAKQARIVEQYDMIASRIKYTFSLVNGMYMFQRIVRSAFTSVKELDASMNSIAVVTNMTTDDLWKQIDAYQALASAMGSTVKGSYDVAKLYYQQGRDAGEVGVLTKETLKLSRISGIEYSEATDFMTAALNGFKLEVTDASRVTDIYSNLAAKAAVDQKDIAYAMTKTASIANNAGMSIENTSALLTQMMETTREAPENIGTAMKTIIARFAEMKSNVGTTFTDEDGEMVDVNRVEGALRAAGVKLRDAITGEIRPVDQVFLELASKWDGLSKNTQRYVATISAGARQQSRFIAMMDNYKRTLELVDIAESSAGAGDLQFAKTLDSLESKLNKLKNAWTEFTTGIANSNMIKFVVDSLTGLLNVVNKLTSGTGGGIGKLLLLFGGFKLAGGIVAKTVDGFTSMFSKAALNEKSKLQGVGQVLAGQINQGMTSSVNFTRGQIIGNAVAAKVITNRLTKAVADNPDGLTYSKLGDIFSNDKKGSKASNAKFQERLSRLAPMFKDTAEQITAQFTTSLSDMPDQVKQLGVETSKSFTQGIESGDFKGALQKYSDFYSQDLPRLQAEAATENKQIAASMSEWSIGDNGTLFETGSDVRVDRSSLQGADLAAYDKYMSNQQVIGAKLPKEGKIDPNTIKQMSNQFSSLGEAAGMSAQAIGGIAQLLGGMGFTGAAGLLNGLATAFGTVGAAAAAAGAMASTGWLTAYTVILAIMAVAGAAYGIASLVKASSPEGKLEKATEATKLAQSTAEQAQSQYKQLIQTISDNGDAVNAIASLTDGTIEFKQAVLEANAEMVKLLNQHPELNTAANVVRNEDGVLTFTQAGQEAFTTSAYQGQVDTQMALGASQANKNNAQEAVDFKSLVKSATGRSFTKYNQAFTNSIVDYMEKSGKSASEVGFWDNPEVKQILEKSFSTALTYTDSFGNEYTNGAANENLRIQEKIKKSGAGFDSYVAGKAEKQAQNSFIYEQMGQAYKTSSKASSLVKDGVFTDLANNYLKENYTPAEGTTQQLRYGKQGAFSFLAPNADAKYSRAKVTSEAEAAGFEGTYKQSLLRLYAEQNKDLGYTFDGKEVKDSAGNTLDINSQNKNGIIDALSAYEQSDDYATKLEELVTTLDTQTATTKDSFGKLATDAGKLNNADYEAMNAALMGMEDDNPAKKILKAEYDAQLKERIQSSGTLLSTLQEVGGSTEQLNNLQSKLGSMTKDQTDAMNMALSGVNQNFGAAATNQVYDQLMGLDGSALSDYSATLSKIDYSNSITSLSSMDKLIKSAGTSQETMLTDLRKTMKEQTSESTLFKDLYTADGFKDAQTELTKLYNTNDKITGANVRDLAKESSILGSYLDIAGVSAEGLASILEHIEIGDIGLENVTDSLLVAVSAASQLQSVLGKGFEFIDNKQWARSEAELGKFATDAAGTVLEHFAAGHIGDSEAMDMYGFLFGADKRETVVAEMTAASELAGKDATKAKAGIAKALKETGEVMAKIQKAGNLKPLWEYYNKNINPDFEAKPTDAFTAAITEQGLQLQNLQGDTKEVVQQLQDMYLISEDLATLMLGDLISNTTGLSKSLQEQDYAKMAAAWTTKVQEQGFLLQSEIEILKNMYPDIASAIDSAVTTIQQGGTVVLDLEIGWGTDPETAYTNLLAAFKAAKEKRDAEMAEDPTKALPETPTFQEYASQRVKRTTVALNGDELPLPEDRRLAERVNPIPEIPSKVLADYDDLKDMYSDLGLSAEEMRGPINDYVTDAENGVDGISKKISKFTKEGGWQQISIDATTVEGLDDEEQKAGVESLANAMASAFGEIAVNLTYTGESAGYFQAIADAIAAIKGKTETIITHHIDTYDNIYLAKGTGVAGVSSDTGATVGERGYEVIETKNGAWIAGLNGPESTYLQRGDRVYNHAASQEIVAGKKPLPGYKNGKNDSYGGPALLAEDGYELVQTRTGAYLAGMTGPTVQNLNPEDTVYTHDETKKIMKSMPRFSGGKDSSWGYLGGFSFGGGAASVGGGAVEEEAKESDEWENDFDKQYNLLQIIEDILRTQEKLQDQLVNDAKESATAVANNLAKQTELMRASLESNQELLKRKKEEVASYLKENEKFEKYGSYNAETDLITIDWDEINKSGNEDVEDYINKLEELQSSVQDAEDGIDEANKTLQDIAEQGKDTYSELQDRLYDAIVEREQGIIDGLSSNNDAINNSNSALMDSLQKSIDDDRQARDNTNTEKDIADKERRLALLQRDTSGSYGLEIKQLQEEIKASQEDYTDTLVDQAISQLQDSYDLASEAREREIEMMQNQKDWREENGFYWNEVIGLLSGSSYGSATDQAAIDQIMKLLGSTDAEFIGASQEQKDQYLEELTSQFSDALGWFWNQNQSLAKGTRTDRTTTDKGEVFKNTYDTITYYDPNGDVAGIREILASSESEGSLITIDPNEGKPQPKAPSGSKSKSSGSGELVGYIVGNQAYGTKKQAENAKAKLDAKNPNSGENSSYEIKKRFATGGLADYTGPAWMDGSKANPELVLKPVDTQNFMQLTNILGDIMKSGVKGEGSGSGASQIQVDLHIDKLDNSTDMDALATKVENAIIKKAKYRNVTVLGMQR